MIGWWLDHPGIVEITVALCALGTLALAVLWPIPSRPPRAPSRGREAHPASNVRIVNRPPYDWSKD